jgi:hypothetical protein
MRDSVHVNVHGAVVTAAWVGLAGGVIITPVVLAWLLRMEYRAATGASTEPPELPMEFGFC